MPPERLKLATDFFKTINDGMTKSDFNKYLEAVLKLVGNIEKKMTARYDEALKRIEARVASIKDGENGKDAVVDYQKLAKLAAPLVPRPKDAEPVDYKKAALETVKLIPIPKDGQDGVVDMSEIQRLQDELDALKRASAGPRIGWGAHPLNIQASGVIKAKGARHLNFTGATVTQGGDGVTTIAINAGGINPQIPSGTIDSSNTTFTCTGIVSVAFLDGNPDSTASISGSPNSTIVYSQPPQQYVFAF